MAALGCWVSRYMALFTFAVCLSISPALLAQQPTECSLSRTNKSCKLVIDRANPVAPSTVQMYSNQALIVVVKNPLPFERYFLDFTTGQATLTPDVTSSIAQGLFPNLGKAMAAANAFSAYVAPLPTAGCADPNLSTVIGWPAQHGVHDAAISVFAACFSELAKEAISTYQDLEPLVAPDSLTPNSPAAEPDYYRKHRDDILKKIQKYVNSESIVSTKITNMGKDVGKGNTYTGADADDYNWITQLGDFQKIIDAISADLLGYSQRITDLGPCNYGLRREEIGGLQTDF